MLEAGQHAHNSYVTLTYDKEPPGGNLSLRDVQLWLKRLRKSVGPVRYFVVGEYGSQNWRPHYHAVLFGLREGLGVERAWGQGYVHCSGVGPESAAYVAGYCLKGAFNESGMRWLGRPGLVPEFARMSRRPGLGVAAAARLVDFYSSQEGSRLQTAVGTVLRYQQQKWPLGRFLRSKVLDGLGIDLEALRKVRQLESAAELRAMSAVELNDLVEHRSFKSLNSGLKAEARAKRMALERKL